ncbi:hypothetical protein SMACR_08947 [Sordaria macrospora]|uniref:Uncharacterized protein n=1 Tax=Sordaria macrospora TaxID=5147 RepID=A0A8S8ZNM0_SORMA|nr:hypothetical protein SMACR_08947 [Sordaria macrospora]
MLTPDSSLKDLHKLPHILKPTVHRHRRHTNNIRFPLVANHTILLQRCRHLIHQPIPQQQAQLCPPLQRIPRRNDLERRLLALRLSPDNLIQQMLRIRCQHQRLAPQILHARLVEHRQRSRQTCQVDCARVTDLETLRARRRLELLVHVEPHAFVRSVPARQSWLEHRLARAHIHLSVTLVHESTGHGTGATVEVLVRAPDSEVDVPVVKLELDVTRAVGQVPADNEAALLSILGDARNVEQLAGVVLDTRQEKQCRIFSMLIDRLEDLLRRQVKVLIRLNLHHRLLGVQTMPFDLALESVPITREGAPLEDDFVPLLSGPVEGGHHEVQVDGQSVHHDDFGRVRGADDGGGLGGAIGCHVLPGREGGVGHG